MVRKSLCSVLLAIPTVLSACDGSWTEALDDGGSQQSPVVARAGTAPEAAAAEVVETVARFRVVADPETDPSGASDAPPPSVLPPSAVGGFVREGMSFVPRIEGRDTRPVLRLPLTADGPFRLTHPRRNLAIDVTLEGASPSPGVPHEGYVVYLDVDARVADVVHRATEEGTEDFVLFERAPEAPEVRYRVDLVEGVAGVRVVARTVEMLDASGTPRLRMSPPWLVDRNGKWHEAAVHVSACDIDVDPRAPWGRLPVSPRSEHCLVDVSWHGAAIAYPAVLDPIWSTTGGMTVARSDARAGVLADGRVLVVGGRAQSIHSSAEIFDPATETWAATGAMSTPRDGGSLSVLLDGSALAAGGGNNLASSERYSPGTGVWTPSGSFSPGRKSHSATVLLDGRVLMVGGRGVGGVMRWAELFDPETDQWWGTDSPSGGRIDHRANVLLDGRVIVTGGRDGNYDHTNEFSIYDPASETWTGGGTLPWYVSGHGSEVLPDGRLLIAGGHNNNAASTYHGAAIFDPATAQWSTIAPLPTLRTSVRAVSLLDGRVLVPGGISGNIHLDAVDVFNPMTGSWSPAEGLSSPRHLHFVVNLPDGRVLVGGGRSATTTYLASCEIHQSSEVGTACLLPGDCLSGHCDDGVCCATPCGGDEADCRACSAQKTGIPDGVCARTLAAVTCRAARSTECDVEELCGGDTDECPLDVIIEPGTACGSGESTECNAPDTCDESGLCATHVAEDFTDCGDATWCRMSQCIAGSCSTQILEGWPCRESVGPCDQTEVCDATGVCPDDAPVPAGGEDAWGYWCSPFLCDGVGFECPTQCASDSGCDASAACIEDVCVLRAELGDPCTVGSWCLSGNCVDEVCCDSSCGGGDTLDCQACDVAGLEGTCAVVPGCGAGSSVSSGGGSGDGGGDSASGGGEPVGAGGAPSSGSGGAAGGEQVGGGGGAGGQAGAGGSRPSGSGGAASTGGSGGEPTGVGNGGGGASTISVAAGTTTGGGAGVPAQTGAGGDGPWTAGVGPTGNQSAASGAVGAGGDDQAGSGASGGGCGCRSGATNVQASPGWLLAGLVAVWGRARRRGSSFP